MRRCRPERLALLAIGLATLAVTRARAAPDPCASAQPEAGVAIRAATGPGELGRMPEACAGTAVTLDAGAALTLDLDDFYGGIRASAALHGRLAIVDDGWLSIGLPALQWIYSANASIEATQLEAGPLTLGAHLGAWGTDTLVLSPFVRLLLPTDTIYERALRFGVELGAVLLYRADDHLELVFGASASEVAVSNPPATLATTSFQLTADATWRPLDWLSLALGLGARLTASDAPFESLDPRVAFRFYPWRGLLIDLSAWVPLAGRDRTTAGALLSIGWTAAK